MVKHNNVLPNQHFKKDWDKFIKTHFDQPAKRIARRAARSAKLKSSKTNPLRLLRPVVSCQTQRYNYRLKLGRGFTPLELKTAGIDILKAPTIGIKVDKRRKNKSQEALDRNVARLKEFMSKLVIFPRNMSKPKSGDSNVEECKKILAGDVEIIRSRDVIPLPVARSKENVEFAPVTAAMQEYKARTDFRMQKAFNLKEAKAKCHKRGGDEEEEDKKASE